MVLSIQTLMVQGKMLTCVEEGLQILTLTIEDLKVTKVQTAMLEYLSLRFSITNHIKNI